MLRTVMLLDGSESMNSFSDYLPSYLLALRRPLMQYVSEYLDSTPLACLGVVVMRDSVSRRLCPCTTNANEIFEKLERDYFLYGGSGATSLENGLRMTLSELVDLQSLLSNQSGVTISQLRSCRKPPQPAVRLRVLLVTASVTFIDPTDVFRVISTFRKFYIQIDVITFHGAVHVLDVCARQTGGQLHCPLRFEHLQYILHQLAVDGACSEELGHGSGRRRVGYTLRFAQRARCAMPEKDVGNKKNQPNTPLPGSEDSVSSAAQVAMVPIGFPILLQRPVEGDANSLRTETYLACPQCHFIQTTIPSTCPLCDLLLCNVGMIFSTFVTHNDLVPPYSRLDPQAISRGCASRLVPFLSSAGALNDKDKVCSEDEDKKKDLALTRDVICHLCVSVVEGLGSGGWICGACLSVRCDVCHTFVTETLGLCPCCIALQ